MKDGIHLPSFFLGMDTMRMKHEDLAGYLTCVLLFVSPFVFVSSLFDYANLPQSVFIQSGASLLLLICSVATVKRGAIRLAGSPAGLVVFIFLLWTLVSLTWAHNRYEGMLSLLHLTACSILFFLIGNCLGEDKWLKRILVAILAAGTGIGLLGCIQHLFNVTCIPQAVPPAATFGNRNVASQFVSMVVPLLPALFFCSRRKSLRFLVAFIALVSLSYLVFSKTRAGWLASFVSISFVLVCLLRDAGRGDSLVKIPRKAVAAVLAPIFSLLVLSLFLFPTLFQNITGNIKDALRHSIVIGGRVVLEDTTTARFAIWKNSLEMIRDRPILGFGMGNFDVFYPIYSQRAIKDKLFSEELQPRNAHNDFIQTAVERGLVGLVLFITMFVTIFLMAHRLASRCLPPRVRLLSIGLAGTFITFLVQAMFGSPMERAISPLILFAFIGVLSALYNHFVATHGPISIKIPRGPGILACLLIFVASLCLARFNFGVVSGDRYYRSAIEMEQAGAWSRVIDSGLKAHIHDPYRMSSLSAVGRAYVRSKETQKGIDALEEVVTAYPYNINALVNLGVAYYKGGNGKKALGIFERALEIMPDSSKVLINVGKIYMKEGDYDNALRAFLKAVKHDEGNAVLHANLGYLNLKKKNYSEAAQAYKTALACDPDMASTHKSLAFIYFRYLREPARAFSHMRAYIKIKPEDQTSELFRKMLGAGRVLRKQDPHP